MTTVRTNSNAYTLRTPTMQNLALDHGDFKADAVDKEIQVKRFCKRCDVDLLAHEKDYCGHCGHPAPTGIKGVWR
jgi:rRNA maturation endonuclease Nob1